MSQDLRAKYLGYLRFELSLSDNTCAAYLADVDKLLGWMEREALPLEQLDYSQLQHFVAQLYDLGIHPNSIVRVISGVRSFGRWLELEGYVAADPTTLLEVPRKGRYLPTVLTTEEVDRIIEAARSRGGIEGLRNAAFIELLFSCGLRVSEACHLRFADTFLDEGYIRVLGKGSKQRLVPLSDSAIRELRCYLAHPDRPTPKRGEEEYIFLSARGKAISPRRCWRVAQGSKPSSCCWGMKMSPPRRSTPISTVRACGSRSSATTHATSSPRAKPIAGRIPAQFTRLPSSLAPLPSSSLSSATKTLSKPCSTSLRSHSFARAKRTQRLALACGVYPSDSPASLPLPLPPQGETLPSSS